LKYDWNSAKQQYGYTFGSGQTDTVYKVYKDTINSGCLWRYAGSMGYDNYFCIPGFTRGHPSFQATTNTASNASPHNTIAGAYTTNKYEDPNTGWQPFGSDNGGKYCSESGSTTPYKVQDVNGDESTLDVGSSASSQSCTGIIDGSVYSLPG
jgi:hypothetical protein